MVGMVMVVVLVLVVEKGVVCNDFTCQYPNVIMFVLYVFIGFMA